MTAHPGTPVGRVVALGASNLTRGFHTVVSTARQRWGREVEILAALGHGRSYGTQSRVLVRTLPGILESGLWRELERRPVVPTLGLVTDVGNDILYGATAGQIVAWVDECVTRLQQHTTDIVLTDLPLASLSQLSPAKFVLFRSLLFPRCRLSLDRVAQQATEVVAGLESLAAARGLRYFHLRPEWYGFDPIHIRRKLWREAWREILGGDDVGAPARAGGGRAARGSRLEAARLYLLRPERQWVLGRERVAPQGGVRLSSGGRVWLY